MPRPVGRPGATYPTPVDPPPDTSPAALCARGALSVGRAARFLGVAPRTLRKLLAAGAIPSLKVGTLRVVPRQALVNYLAGLMKQETGT